MKRFKWFANLFINRKEYWRLNLIENSTEKHFKIKIQFQIKMSFIVQSESEKFSIYYVLKIDININNFHQHDSILMVMNDS